MELTKDSESQPKHCLLSLLLGALGPVDQCTPDQALSPWMKAPREPSAVRPLHKEVLHTPWDRSREGLHLFPTVPSTCHGTATPRLTLFLWKRDVIVNVKSYKMVQNLVFTKISHGRVLLVLFLCVHSRTPDTSPWCIILQVRTPQNNSCLYCGICWHV